MLHSWHPTHLLDPFLLWDESSYTTLSLPLFPTKWNLFTTSLIFVVFFCCPSRLSFAFFVLFWFYYQLSRQPQTIYFFFVLTGTKPISRKLILLFCLISSWCFWCYVECVAAKVQTRYWYLRCHYSQWHGSQHWSHAF